MANESRPGKMAKQPADKKLAGIVLCVVAVLMFFLAWQCVSTEQYKLYERKQSSYEAAAVEYAGYSEDAKREDDSAMYGSLAEKWSIKANAAKQYLLLHRAGAIALLIVGVLALAFGIRSLVRISRKSQELPKPTQNLEQSHAVHMLNADNSK